MRYRTESILFAGASVHFQPGNFTGWDSEGVNNKHKHGPHNDAEWPNTSLYSPCILVWSPVVCSVALII